MEAVQMRKKIMLSILIISIVIQLAVPVGMIAYGNKAEDDLQKYGKDYRFKIYVQNIYGGEVEYHLYDNAFLYQEGKYGVVEEDSDGYAFISETKKVKPKDTNYIRINRENRIKMDKFSVECEKNFRRVKEESSYIVVRVYNGDFEIVELFIDGIPADEWVKKATVEKDEYSVQVNDNIQW